MDDACSTKHRLVTLQLTLNTNTIRLNKGKFTPNLLLSNLLNNGISIDLLAPLPESSTGQSILCVCIRHTCVCIHVQKCMHVYVCKHLCVYGHECDGDLCTRSPTLDARYGSVLVPGNLPIIPAPVCLAAICNVLIRLPTLTGSIAIEALQIRAHLAAVHHWPKLKKST